ncbi:hypothetical protein HNQ71_006863 [Mesorhizobium sangaii]|uniref:Uncharacterized protein n=1 Tax=Mesorhizobium sangaii TaxID=505389 RepID=A0A841PFS5_9HYPH|nr:hypothetical protein [Mesorhizobium sangaii]
MQRLQHQRAGADLVGQRRHAQIDALAGISFALPVQQLMLTELLEQDHRQKVRAGEAPRGYVEGRRRLRDLLAFPARELFAHRLDHLPLARDHFQRLRDVLAQLRQFRRTAAGTAFGRGDDDALARQVLWERLARRPLALERFDQLRLRRSFLGRQLVLCRGRLKVLQLQFHLRQEPFLALRAAAVEFAPQLLDLQLEVCDQRFCRGAHRLSTRRNGLRLHARGPLGEDHRMGASKIGRKRIKGGFHRRERITSSPRSQRQNRYPIDVGRQVSCGFRQSIPESR